METGLRFLLPMVGRPPNKPKRGNQPGMTEKTMTDIRRARRFGAGLEQPSRHVEIAGRECRRRRRHSGQRGGDDPDGTANSTSLVTDYVLNAEQEVTKRIDPRGIEHTTAYDSRGRVKEQVEAAGTAVAAKTVMLYDANGNMTEVQHPRYFDSSDANGYQKSRTTTSPKPAMVTVVS